MIARGLDESLNENRDFKTLTRGLQRVKIEKFSQALQSLP